MGRPLRRLATVGSGPPGPTGVGQGPGETVPRSNTTTWTPEQSGALALKLCSCCHVLTPMTQFFASKRNRDGLQGACKACFAIHDKRYQARLAREISIRKAKKRGRPMKRRPYRSRHNPDGLMPDDRI
mgnify:CR=1 FL=1